jgi:NADH:ubiquinone oxidoreductase subunit 2 (subunit N)
MIAGLSRHNLILALTLAIALLSLAGIPPLAGFISKY